MTTHLHTPPSPHVVVATNRLAITHETEVHSRANEIPVEGKVHAAHGEQGSLGDCHDSINIPEPKKKTELAKTIDVKKQLYECNVKDQNKNRLQYLSFLSLGLTSCVGAS